MTLDSLERLGDGDLRTVAARCGELLAQHDRERKESALEQAKATLAAVGLTLKDLNGKTKSRTAKVPAYHGGHTYQHPTNKALIWNAKGQKPRWLRELEAGGVQPVEVQPEKRAG
jgi:DNA-binding protein H-NS